MHQPIVGTTLLLSALILAVPACSPSQAPAKADLRATDTPGKVPGLVQAAESDDPGSLHELVHALSDDDAAVRLFAAQALRERTGHDFGYRYYETADKRRAAALRWSRWLEDPASSAAVQPQPQP